MVQKRVQKGDSHLLCEAPFGPFRQKVAVTFLNHARIRAWHHWRFAPNSHESGYDSNEGATSRLALRGQVILTRGRIDNARTSQWTNAARLTQAELSSSGKDRAVHSNHGRRPSCTKSASFGDNDNDEVCDWSKEDIRVGDTCGGCANARSRQLAPNGPSPCVPWQTRFALVRTPSGRPRSGGAWTNELCTIQPRSPA
jgi:hypothetical protein